MLNKEVRVNNFSINVQVRFKNNRSHFLFYPTLFIPGMLYIFTSKQGRS